MAGRLLIASGVFERARLVERLALRAGFETAISTRPADSVAACRSDWPDVVAIDAGGSGNVALELCLDLRTANGASAALLVLTDGSGPARTLDALDAGADECLAELDPVILAARLRSLVQWAGLKREVQSWLSVSGLLASDAAARESPKPGILVFESRAPVRERLAEILAGEGPVDATDDPAHALAEAAAGSYAVALVGTQELGFGESGFGALRMNHQIRHLSRRRLPRSVLVAGSENLRPDHLTEGGFDDVVTLPMNRCEVLARVRLALRKHELTERIRQFEHARIRDVPQNASLPAVSPPTRFAA
jgi:DNA-binding response OmpR family regulator